MKKRTSRFCIPGNISNDKTHSHSQLSSHPAQHRRETLKSPFQIRFAQTNGAFAVIGKVLNECNSESHTQRQNFVSHVAKDTAIITHETKSHLAETLRNKEQETIFNNFDNKLLRLKPLVSIARKVRDSAATGMPFQLGFLSPIIFLICLIVLDRRRT